MADEQGPFQTCAECGATIYPEHIERQVAQVWEGNLLCQHCAAEKRPDPEPVALRGSGRAGDDTPITLAGEGEPTAGRSPTIRAIGGGPGGMTEGLVSLDGQELRRPLLKDSPNATRCRTFHCKLADASFGHLNEQINAWVDGKDDIEIKFATSCIGVVEGKHADPHLLVTVFY